MKKMIYVALLALMSLPTIASGQEPAEPSDASFFQTASKPGRITADSGERLERQTQSSGGTDPAPMQPAQPKRTGLGLDGKFGYYMSETYLNPSALTAPAFRAGLRMANPPGKGAAHYPPEWRQGAEAFGRNYGDAFVERTSFQTARFVTGVIAREDPRYSPSGSHNIVARSLHALSFTFVDRSDSGHPMPALSNFVGAAAGGFVGNAYLPAGFNDVTHAGQRASIRFAFAVGGNLFREFAPQMPGPLRTSIMLIAR